MRLIGAPPPPVAATDAGRGGQRSAFAAVSRCWTALPEPPPPPAPAAPCPGAPGGRRSAAHARAAAWNFLLRAIAAGKIGPLPEKFGVGRL